MENHGKKLASGNIQDTLKNRNVLESRLQNTEGANHDGTRTNGQDKRQQANAGGLYSSYFENMVSQINPQRTPMTVEEMLKMKRNEPNKKKV